MRTNRELGRKSGISRSALSNYDSIEPKDKDTFEIVDKVVI
jgi:hypothetical protein